MASGLCGTCRAVLTIDNGSASSVKKGFGLCRICDVAYNKVRPIKIRFCSNENCGKQLSEENSCPSSIKRGGLCRVCHKAKNRIAYFANPEKAVIKQQRWREKNPEKYAIRLRKAASRVYGSTKEEFDLILLSQNGCCAICNKLLDDPCQDHNHITKKIRGILCRKCNLMIGYASDDANILANAIQYLQKYANDSTTEIICVEAAKPLS